MNIIYKAARYNIKHIKLNLHEELINVQVKTASRSRFCSPIIFISIKLKFYFKKIVNMPRKKGILKFIKIWHDSFSYYYSDRYRSM